jgi:hypothetical protein
VVLHCPFILLLWDAHANTEYGASWSLPVYLFKYFYKGPDTTGFKIAAEGSNQVAGSSNTRSACAPVDEIKNYQRGRYLSAMEAAWRLASFGITRKDPTVERLMIHTEGRQRGQMGRTKAGASDATSLMRYFDRPDDPRLINLTYVEFGERTYPVKHDPDEPMHPLDILERDIPGRPRQRIRLRSRGAVVARIVMVYAHHGDVFYLRIILMHRPASGFLDAQTFLGVVYSTFQEATVAMGLFAENNEGELAFLELLELGVTPARLRWVFCLLALDGNPMRPLWDAHQVPLSEDFRVRRIRENRSSRVEAVLNDALCDLQELLGGMGSNLRDIGLPDPVAQHREVDEEVQLWQSDPYDLQSFESSLTHDQVSPLSRKRLRSSHSFQRLIFDRLRIKCQEESPSPTYFDGRAGRGKTFCLYPLIGALRKEGKIVLISASTAFAAKNYPGGRTLHYTYGVPVDEYAPFLESNVRPRTERAVLCMAAGCHIVDEIGGLHYKAFSAADRLMRGLTGKDKVWGGRMLITLGDFRQVSVNPQFPNWTSDHDDARLHL